MRSALRLGIGKTFLWGALVSCLLLTAAAGPQTAQQPPLKHEVSVTLKLVQVYVTDKSGKPVRDLNREEFRVTDNGRPVAISAFEKHDLAAAPVGAAAAEAPAPEPAPASGPAEAPALSRKFIILFDFAFNTMSGLKSSIEAAGHFLDAEVRPGDELAFMSYSMLRGIRIHEFLTTDHAKIRAALAKVSTKDVAGRADEVELKYWLAVENPNLGEDMWTQEMARRDSMHQASNYLRELTRLAQALRLVQGQKSVLFFSNGIPSSMINSSRGVGTSQYLGGPGTGSVDGARGTSASRGSTFQVGNYELRPLQEAMFKEFSSSSCSIYTFDTRESSKIPALFTFDEMQFLGRSNGGMLAADTGGIFRDDKTTGMDSLKSLSKQTAGKYYSNILFHEKNLSEVSAVTATYYVLGYTIQAAADGAFHRIDVGVSRKGCEVRTQPGYFNPKPFKDYTDLERDIQLFDLALNEKPEFEAPKALPLTALSYDGGQGQRARAVARIPGRLWRELGGGQAEIVALFFDAQDDLLSLQRVAVNRADFGEKDVLFTAGVAARPGAVKCRVIVRDLDTGRSAVGSKTVYCAKPGGQGLVVYSPVLLGAGGGLFRLEGVVKGAEESPSWREIYPFDAQAFSPVVGDEAVAEGAVSVVVPYSAPGLVPADLTFSANLVSTATGEKRSVALEPKGAAKPGTLDVDRFEIPLEGIPNGKYLLYIHVGNRVTGQVASANVPLTIAR